MFDATIRPWIDLTFNPLGRRLAQQGATADQVTIAGFALGLGSAFAIAAGQFKLSLTLIALNRVCDGLDGAIARATRPTDRGGFLDIVLDFVFYASVPLAFAFHDPAHNAVAAAALIAAFLANGGAFLAYAAAAAKRGITTTAQGSNPSTTWRVWPRVQRRCSCSAHSASALRHSAGLRSHSPGCARYRQPDG
jgi:phosphatidylglycerophosphate synthase